MKKKETSTDWALREGKANWAVSVSSFYNMFGDGPSWALLDLNLRHLENKHVLKKSYYKLGNFYISVTNFILEKMKS